MKHMVEKQEQLMTGSAILVLALTTIAITCAAAGNGNGAVSDMAAQLSAPCAIAALVIATMTAVIYGYTNHFYKGFEYGWEYACVMHDLRRSLIDAGVYEIDISGQTKLPRIVLNLDAGLQSGTLRIRNSVHYNKPLESMNMSSALGRYVIESWYLSEDQNWYIYEFYDAGLLKSVVLHDLAEFREFIPEGNMYVLRIDQRLTIKCQHMLIVGATGSGKTYTLYGILLQLMISGVPKMNLWFTDPKHASLYAIGKRLQLFNNECTVDGIAQEIIAYRDTMLARADYMNGLLSKKLDADYRDFGLTPYFLVIDEFASFIGSLQTYPKAERDKVMSALRDIVLMGRQVGFFIIIVMQKSDATSIPTMLRDNLTFKMVLGNAEDTTYTTAFGAGSNIPKRNFKTGEGVYTCAEITNEPRLCEIPTLDFDIGSAFDEVSDDEAGAM